MLSKFFLLLIALGCTVTASPAKLKKHSYNATFTGLADPGIFGETEGLPVPAGYDHLSWSGFHYGDADTSLIAFTDIFTRTVDGVKNATLSAAYTNSTTSYFNFKSFAFFCSIFSPVPFSAAQTCTVEVLGYKGSKLVGQQVFTVVPPGAEDAYLVEQKLKSSFYGITSATVAVIASKDSPALTVMVADYFAVDVYTK